MILHSHIITSIASAQPWASMIVILLSMFFMRAKCCKATDLLILRINYIGMIRQKRFSINRIASNQSRASNQHTLDPIFGDK